jgi:hypothetical protein
MNNVIFTSFQRFIVYEFKNTLLQYQYNIYKIYIINTQLKFKIRINLDILYF